MENTYNAIRFSLKPEYRNMKYNELDKIIDEILNNNKNSINAFVNPDNYMIQISSDPVGVNYLDYMLSTSLENVDHFEIPLAEILKINKVTAINFKDILNGTCNLINCTWSCGNKFPIFFKE